MRILCALFVVALPGITRAEVITFDFEGGAGSALDGLGTGLVVASGGAISLTLRATAGDGTFGLGASSFGIDNSESDIVDAFDQDTFVADSVNFEIVSSNVSLQSLELTSLEFDDFTAGDSDEGIIFRTSPFSPLFGAGGQFSDGDLSVDDVLTLNAAMTVGSGDNDFTLSYFAGGGFGLERITFNATAAVPEPASCGVLLVFAGAAVVWRKRRRGIQA